jgi:hypothetical protein
MPRRSLEDDLAPGVGDDPRHDSERRAGLLEHRPLLDVELHVATGKLPPLGQRAATDATVLFVAEADHTQGSLGTAHSLDSLEPSDDAERAVELPAARNAVEVRAGPDLGQPRPRAGQTPNDVPVRIGLDFEAGLLHPDSRELESLLLRLAPARPVCTRPAPERVESVEALERASRRRGHAAQRRAVVRGRRVPAKIAWRSKPPVGAVASEYTGTGRPRSQETET